MRARHIAHHHLHGDFGDEQYADGLRLLDGITSRWPGRYGRGPGR
jgi:hypothetical protein